MARTKTGVVRRRSHKKVLERTKGMRMTKNRLIKVAIEADLHAGQYAYNGRKLRKRDFRKLWIIRLNAALRAIDEKLKYSVFISQLKKANVMIDRKVMAEIAFKDADTFKAIVDSVSK
ncbi:MAG TPA: 50S ribosomal protein L20 [Patescibacteria group bacterium]|nr:50S ribosomal protein L20 [Patescibacteria group bacterium]